MSDFIKLDRNDFGLVRSALLELRSKESPDPLGSAVDILLAAHNKALVSKIAEVAQDSKALETLLFELLAKYPKKS